MYVLRGGEQGWGAEIYVSKRLERRSRSEERGKEGENERKESRGVEEEMEGGALMDRVPEQKEERRRRSVDEGRSGGGGEQGWGAEIYVRQRLEQRSRKIENQRRK